VAAKLKDTTLSKELKKATEEESKTLNENLETLKKDQKISETLYNQFKTQLATNKTALKASIK